MEKAFSPLGLVGQYLRVASDEKLKSCLLWTAYFRGMVSWRRHFEPFIHAGLKAGIGMRVVPKIISNLLEQLLKFSSNSKGVRISTFFFIG